MVLPNPDCVKKNRLRLSAQHSALMLVIIVRLSMVRLSGEQVGDKTERDPANCLSSTGAETVPSPRAAGHCARSR